MTSPELTPELIYRTRIIQDLDALTQIRGEIPSLESRLKTLESLGPLLEAFSIKNPFNVMPRGMAGFFFEELVSTLSRLCVFEASDDSGHLAVPVIMAAIREIIKHAE